MVRKKVIFNGNTFKVPTRIEDLNMCDSIVTFRKWVISWAGDVIGWW